MQFYCIGGVRKPRGMLPPFASRSATRVLRIELIKLLIMACGMLVHFSSMAVRSCWILEGTGTRCRIRRSRASQTWSMGDMSGEYAGHARTGRFSASRNRSLQHGAVHYHAASCMLCSLSITYACSYHNPTATMGQSIHNVDINKPLTHTMPHTLSAICPVQWKPGFIREENSSPKSQTPSNVSICPQVDYDDELQSGRDPDEDDKHAASMRRFMTVCAEIHWLCKPIFLQQLSGWLVSDNLGRWRCWMWRSWAGVVTRGLWLWGRLDVLPNSLKRLWRRLIVEKWTFNSRATALVDIPAVSMPIACSLKT